MVSYYVVSQPCVSPLTEPLSVHEVLPFPKPVDVVRLSGLYIYPTLVVSEVHPPKPLSILTLCNHTKVPKVQNQRKYRLYGARIVPYILVRVLFRFIPVKRSLFALRTICTCRILNRNKSQVFCICIQLFSLPR